MTIDPIIARLADTHIGKPILSTGDIQRIESRARDMRAHEIARLFAAAVAWIKTFIMEPIASAIRAERSYNELMALDDRTLAEIGLRRDEIPAFIARAIATPQASKTETEPKSGAARAKGEPKLAA